MSQPTMCVFPDDSEYIVKAKLWVERKDGQPFPTEKRTFEVDGVTISLAEAILANATSVLNKGGLNLYIAVMGECGMESTAAEVARSEL